MKNGPVICIGAALIDETYSSQSLIITGTSNPSAYSQSAGGVARNIAAFIAQLGHPVELITQFGNDSDGDWLIQKCLQKNIGLNHALRNDFPSGRFMALLQPNGDLFSGAAVSHLESSITPGYLESKTDFLKHASLLLLDCNLSEASLQWLISFAALAHIPCIAEPVSIEKAKRLRDCSLENMLLLSPNEAELHSMTGIKNSTEAVDSLLEKGLRYLWMREGKKGSRIFSKEKQVHLKAPNIHVKDSTGAGDAALAGWIHAWLLGKNVAESQQYGHALAGLVLQESGAEIPHLTSNRLENAYLQFA